MTEDIKQTIINYQTLEKTAEVAASNWCVKRNLGFFKIRILDFDFEKETVTFKRFYSRDWQIHAIPLNL